MKISCSTYGHRNLSVDKTIERFADLGFEAIDFMATRPHLHPHDYTDEDINGIKRRLDSVGLEVGALSPFDGTAETHFTTNNESHRRSSIDRVKRVVDFAAMLGAKSVQVLSGMPLMLDVPRSDAWKHARDSFREIAEHAEQRDVYLALEGEEWNIVRTSSDILQMTKDVDHPNFRALFEVGHANWLENDEPLYAVDLLKDYIVHCHVHDNYGTGDDHAAPGEGNIFWEGVLRKLIDIGYDGYLSMELLVPDPDASAVRGKRYLEGVLADLTGAS